MKMLLLFWAAWAGPPSNPACVMDRTAARPVLTFLEVPADKPQRLIFPLHGSSGEAQFEWDGKVLKLSGPVESGREGKSREYRVDMPALVKQSPRLWKTMRNDLDGALSLTVPEEKLPASQELIGVLRYPNGKGEILQFAAYRLKSRQGIDMAKMGMDEQGRWLVIRCGPLASD